MTDAPIHVESAIADITITIKTLDGRVQKRTMNVALAQIKTFISSGENIVYLEGTILQPPSPTASPLGQNGLN